MPRKTLQEKTEESVFESLEQIADEMELDVPFYPEVYRIGRNFPFETLGLPEKYREDFEEIKREKTSIYFYQLKIILIGTDDMGDIAEEAGHFLHFVNSGIKYTRRKKIDQLSLHILIEMFGFFCSKLVEPDRKNLFNEYPDIIDENSRFLFHVKKEGLDYDEFLIYQQGYSLGEKLFDFYISELTPKEEIRKLFLNNFSNLNEALSTFLYLKYNLLK